MRWAQNAFTLVELMVIVAVVAIIAAIAIPQYQGYALRAKISEALAISGACKTAVTDYVMSNNTLPADLGASGCQGYGSTQYVGSIDVVNGVITVTMATLAELGPASGRSLKLSPTMSAGNKISAWKCEPDDLPPSLLPGPCRS